MKRFLVLLVFFIAHTLVAQDNVLTAQDVAKIEAITNIVISPDGQKIAYQKVVPANPLKENVPAKSHLYIYDLSTKESTALVTDYSISNIKFRPGTGSITFTAKRDKDETTAVYEMQTSGGEASKIYEFQASISSYDWHSNGTRLAFVANKPQDKKENELPYTPEIYETDLQTSIAFV